MVIKATRIKSVEWNSKELGHHSELDSHADTCVVGDQTALILQDYERPVRVHGYDDRVGEARNCKTVLEAIASTTQRQGTFTCCFFIKPF
jgi:hypothetical protein